MRRRERAGPIRAQPQRVSPRSSALSCCLAVAEPAGLLLSIFTSDLLPIFLVAGVGFLLSRFVRVDVMGWRGRACMDWHPA